MLGRSKRRRCLLHAVPRTSATMFFQLSGPATSVKEQENQAVHHPVPLRTIRYATSYVLMITLIKMPK